MRFIFCGRMVLRVYAMTNEELRERLIDRVFAEIAREIPITYDRGLALSTKITEEIQRELEDDFASIIKEAGDILEAEKAARERAEGEVVRLRQVLIAVEEWDLNWADGLDANVEKIKNMVRAALEGDDV